MSLPGQMQAVEIARPGGPDVLTPVMRPVPRPGAGEILIKVAHAGVNRPDALQRAGNYAPPPGASDLPGLECAGHIAAIGQGVGGWAEGGGWATGPEPMPGPSPCHAKNNTTPIPAITKAVTTLSRHPNGARMAPNNFVGPDLPQIMTDSPIRTINRIDRLPRRSGIGCP